MNKLIFGVIAIAILDFLVLAAVHKKGQAQTVQTQIQSVQRTDLSEKMVSFASKCMSDNEDSLPAPKKVAVANNSVQQPNVCQPNSGCQPQSCQPRVCQPQSCQPRVCQPQSCQPRVYQPQSCQPRVYQPQSCQPSYQSYNCTPVYNGCGTSFYYGYSGGCGTYYRGRCR